MIYSFDFVPKTKHSANCRKAGYWNGSSASDMCKEVAGHVNYNLTLGFPSFAFSEKYCIVSMNLYGCFNTGVPNLYCTSVLPEGH